MCSSSRSKPSLLGKHYTEFSGALLHVLNTGFKDELKYMSLDMVADLVREFLDETGSEAPRPEVHSPNQREGDVATIPFFPNPWAERQAEEELLRMEEEERLHKAEEARRAEEVRLAEEERVRKAAEAEQERLEQVNAQLEEQARLAAEAERLRKLELLETTITNKDNKPDVMALIRQQFADSDVLALGQPTSDLFYFTVDDFFGEKQKVMLVFTQVNMANMMREALLCNPEWRSLKVSWVNGKALLERLKQDVTIIINPESSLEFRLPITQKQVYKAEQEQPPKEVQVRKTANHLQSRRTVGTTIHRPAVQPPILPSNKPFTSFQVWSLNFFLLTGLESMVDFLTHSTQSLQWTVGTVALTTPLAYILAVGTVALATPLAYILGYRKAMNFLTMTILAFMSAAAVFGLTGYCFQLDFDYQRTSQLWFNLTRILWFGKQANFGLILGSISGGFLIYVVLDEGRKPEKKPQNKDVFPFTFLIAGFMLILIVWLVLAILALIFQWGFGFGYGWDTSLIAAGVGFLAASGFIGSFFFCIGALSWP